MAQSSADSALTQAVDLARDLIFIKPIMVMPQTPQLIATVVFALGALATLYYALVVAKKSGTSYPIWVYVGSLVALPFETFDLTLGHCLYPQVDQWVAFELVGVKIPWFLVLIYPCYIAGAMIWVFDRLNSNNLSRATWWKFCAFGIISAAAFEPPALHFGLWTYYGDNQPFRLFGLPFWWAFANPAAIICMGMICYYAWDSLKRRVGTPWLLALLPVSLFAVHTGVSAPLYLAINSTQNVAIVNAAAVMTAVLSLYALWLCSRTLPEAQVEGRLAGARA